MAKKKPQQQGIQWHKLVNVQDIGDIAALALTARKLLERRGQQAARNIEHGVRDVRDSHAMEDFAAVVERLTRLFVRKRREFSRASQHAAEQINEELKRDTERLKQEAAHLRKEVEGEIKPLRQKIQGIQGNVEETVSTVRENVRDTVDQKSYEVAKGIVERHEAHQRENGADAGVFIVGAIVGVAVGAALALWYAPQSGEETRLEIERAAEGARRRVEGETLNDALREGKEVARRFQERTAGR